MERHQETAAGDWRVAGELEFRRSRFHWLTRPMSPFEMMDDAVAFFRENFALMAKASVLLYAPLLGLFLLTLIPIALLNATARAPQPLSPADLIQAGSTCLAYPYFFVAPALHAAIIALIAQMRLQEAPITPRTVWERLKPRFWHLIANQLLAFIALGGASVGLILGLSGALILGILWVVAVAMATVWFAILPPIVVLEPHTDALTAFNHAFQLVGKNYRHAVLSYLAFIGFQTVVYFAAYLLVVIIIGIAAGLIEMYSDLEAFFLRWNATLTQLFNLLYYTGFVLLMPMMYMSSILLYYDLRYRYEGLDIEQVLMQEGASVS
jgi:hypothetical protein